MLLELCYFLLEFVQVNQLVHVFVIKSAKENGLKKKIEKKREIEMKHAWKRKETVEHVNCNWNLELHVSLQPFLLFSSDKKRGINQPLFFFSLYVITCFLLSDKRGEINFLLSMAEIISCRCCETEKTNMNAAISGRGRDHVQNMKKISWCKHWLASNWASDRWIVGSLNQFCL